MKLNPMSPTIAAAVLLLTTGATLSITPAHADEAVPAPIVQTIDQYELSSFKEPVFEAPKVTTWAVAYKADAPVELDPAQKALLTEDAQLAQKQKANIEKEGAVKRVEQERVAAEKAAAEKAEADRLAAVKAAEEKAEADRVAAQAAADAQVEAERKAAEEAIRVAAEQEAAAQATAAQANSTSRAAQANVPVTGTNYSAPSTPTAAPAPAAPAPASSGIGAALVASAYSQLGVKQDCTAMVEKALRSVGKSVGDLAPTQFYAYGTVVTNPQPGDLMIQPGHVAIYVGNGMAISGGFNGYDTVLHPAKYLTGAVYVRVS